MPAPKFKKLTVLTLVEILAIAVLGWLSYRYFFPEKSYIEKEYLLKDSTMGGQIAQGESLKEIKGYYEENKVKRGDLVMVKLEGREPFARLVSAVPGDKISFEGAYLELNGEVQKNSKAEAYLFPDTVRDSLSGKVPQDSYLVISDQTSPSSFDSRQFGFVEKSQLQSRLVK
jgi:signal peptidase I